MREARSIFYYYWPSITYKASGLGSQHPLEAAGESLPHGVHLLLTDTDIG